MVKITSFQVCDVRFPTSLELHGSDAMHKSPDYSAAYLTLATSDEDLTGYGFAFTLGRGTEIVVNAIELFEPLVVGRDTETIFNSFASFWRELVSEDQIRWLGPEKGVTHLAIAAIINALWDLWGKIEKKPVWKLLADMEPDKLVSTIDFTYLTDVLTPKDVLEILDKNRKTKGDREKYLLEYGYPAYTTSVGWKGYTDDKIRLLCKQALKEGWTRFKMKVGTDIEDDIRRTKVIREEIGYDHLLMMDANQVWDVNETIEHMKQLSHFKPYWIEEPTSPDDVLGHAAIRKSLNPLGINVATGEACQNRVMFKQFIQAGAFDVCQLDTCRVGGVNENLAIIFMAAKYGIPICPHAGGVGLCELAQHLSMFDYISVSGTMENRMTEYVDHLHEHFIHPVIINNGNYKTPLSPGYDTEMKESTIYEFAYPNGPVWKQLKTK